MFYRILKRIGIICILLGIAVIGYQKTVYAGEVIYIKNEVYQKAYKKDDGSYAKNEWIEWKYESGTSKWRYFNRFGNVVIGYFEVNGKMYYADISGEIYMNSNIVAAGYYADETGALKTSKDGSYIKPFFNKKITCHVEGFPTKVVKEYDSDYQLLSEDWTSTDDGRKAYYRFEYDSNGNLVKFKAMEGENKLLYTVDYTYDGKYVVKQEYKDANENIKLTRLMHYNNENRMDLNEWLRADGSSIVKYEGGRFNSGSIQDAYDEWDKFIKETCPEGSLFYDRKYGQHYDLIN